MTVVETKILEAHNELRDIKKLPGVKAPSVLMWLEKHTISIEALITSKHNLVEVRGYLNVVGRVLSEVLEAMNTSYGFLIGDPEYAVSFIRIGDRIIKLLEATEELEK